MNSSIQRKTWSEKRKTSWSQLAKKYNLTDKKEKLPQKVGLITRSYLEE